MREILHALRDVLHSFGRFYMLGVRACEIVSRHETHAQCVRVDSPVLAFTVVIKGPDSPVNFFGSDTIHKRQLNLIIFHCTGCD